MIFVEIFHDFGWFFATQIRFIEADPDPADKMKLIRIRETKVFKIWGEKSSYWEPLADLRKHPQKIRLSC